MTFMKNFCCAGNLTAILEDEKLPEALHPYIAHLKKLYEPSEKLRRQASNSKLEPLEPIILKSLTKGLNAQRQEDCIWVMPEKWASMSKQSSLGFAPVAARAVFHNQVEHLDVNFSTFRASKKIVLLSSSRFKDTDALAESTLYFHTAEVQKQTRI